MCVTSSPGHPGLVLDQLSMWDADGHGGRDGKTGFAGASAPKGRGTAPRVGLVATNVVRFCASMVLPLRMRPASSWIRIG
jgi:hypothetical protein